VFLDPHNRPSFQLRRVARIVSAVSIQKNPLLWLLINGHRSVGPVLG